MNVGSVYYLKIKVLYFRKNTFDSLKRHMYRLKIQSKQITAVPIFP